MSDHDIARFGRRAPRYERGIAHRHFFQPVQRATLRLAARQAAQRTRSPAVLEVLDVGCGTGALLRMAAQVFPAASLHGIDAAEEMVAVANASADPVRTPEFAHARVEDLPFDSGSMGLVVSTMSFHHWSDQVRGLREIRRVLDPEGVAVVADHFAISWLRPLAAVAGKRARMRTRPEVGSMAGDAGLIVTAWENVYRLPGRVPFVTAAVLVGAG